MSASVVGWRVMWFLVNSFLATTTGSESEVLLRAMRIVVVPDADYADEEEDELQPDGGDQARGRERGKTEAGVSHVVSIRTDGQRPVRRAAPEVAPVDD